mgnify:CR=1 FL=1
MDTLIPRCRTVLMMSLVTCFLSLTGCASMLATDGAKKEWLFVHTAEDAQVKSSAVIVMTAERDIFAFTDRPNREHMYLTPEEYVSLWNDNGSADNFFADPPNAVLTWITPSGSVNESEIIITGASFKKKAISYTYKGIDGSEMPLHQTIKRISLFVDGIRDCLHEECTCVTSPYGAFCG